MNRQPHSAEYGLLMASTFLVRAAANHWRQEQGQEAGERGGGLQTDTQTDSMSESAH